MNWFATRVQSRSDNINNTTESHINEFLDSSNRANDSFDATRVEIYSLRNSLLTLAEKVDRMEIILSSK